MSDRGQTQQAQVDFSLGMVRDAAPHLIDSRATYDLINGLVDEHGSPYKRGGTEAKSTVIGNTATRTNLSTNPKAGTGATTNWTNSGLNTFAASSFTAATTPNLTGLPADVATGFHFGESTSTGLAYNTIAVSNGQTYRASIYGYRVAGLGYLAVWDASGTLVALSSLLSSGVWGRSNVTFTATATANWRVGVLAQVSGSGLTLTPANIYATALLVEEDAALNPYFDGDSLGGSWSGTAELSTSSLASEGAGLRFLWDGYFDAGRRTVYATDSDFGVLDTDDETPINLGSDGLSGPKPAALLEGTLFIGGGYIYAGSRKAAVYSTGTVTATNGSKTVTGSGTTWNTLTDAGMLFQAANTERVYVVASIDSTTQLTLRDAYEGSTGSGKSYTLNPLYKIASTDPYRDGEFYEVCANRLCTASGSEVRFSGIPDSTTGVAQPETWATTDYHRLPQGAQITGLATSGQALLIFSTAGIWVLEGLAFDIVDAAGNGNHRLQQLSRELYLWSNTGIATWSQAVIAPCMDGIYLLDGVSGPTRISHPIDSFYRGYVQRGYRAGQATVFRGHYFLPILNSTATDTVDLLVCHIDHPTRSEGQTVFPWSRFSGNGGELVGFANRLPTGVDDPLLLGAEIDTNSRIVDCTAYFSSDAEHRYDADGSAPPWVLVTRDFETGNTTVNNVRKLRTRAELVDGGADDPEIIIDWGTGRREAGTYFYDACFYDDEDADDTEDAYYEDDDDEIWNELVCTIPENEGHDTYTCRINKDARYIRYRFRCLDPAAVLRFRSLEQFVRPSRAMRR